MNTLEFNDINYKVRTGKGKKAVTRHILKNVNGNFVGGELVAIIGSSGAGKTTLLNILAGRVTGGIVTGEILFNGSRRVESQFKKMIAYVEQDDLLYPTLTVYETLLYAAKLRVDNKRFNLSDKKERVENVIRQLRLTNSRNTLIGNEKIRGVSGGERKRVSIGVEIITDPLMLMLDEPTSGLDSNSAENVIKLIKEFTIEKNVITVCSIHQPNSTIYSLFDKLVLLAPGGVVYMGSRADSLDYFSSIGYDCPTQENPADFFINLMTLDTLSEESLEESTKRVEHIKNSWAEKMARESSDTKEEENIQASRDQTNRSSVLSRGGALCRRVSRRVAFFGRKKSRFNNSWPKELFILLRRSWLKQVREKQVLFSALLSSIITMLLVGFTFFNPGSGFQKAQNRIGLIFLITINLIFPVIMPILGVLIYERSVMTRERASGAYRVSTYMLSVILTKLPIAIAQNFIMLSGIYLLVKFQHNFIKYLVFMAIYLSTVFTSFGFAMAVSASVSNAEVASILAPIVLTVFLIYGGNLVNAGTIPAVLSWIRYVSYIYYTYMAQMQNLFTGLKFECDNDKSVCYPTGEAVLDSFNLNSLGILPCVVFTLTIGVAFYTVAYVLLRFKAKPKYIFI